MATSTGKASLRAGGRATVTGRSVFAVAGHGGHQAVRTDSADALVVGVGQEHAAVVCQGDVRGGVAALADRQREAGLQGRAAVAVEAALAVAAKVVITPAGSMRRIRWLA